MNELLFFSFTLSPLPFSLKRFLLPFAGRKLRCVRVIEFVLVGRDDERNGDACIRRSLRVAIRGCRRRRMRSRVRRIPADSCVICSRPCGVLIRDDRFVYRVLHEDFEVEALYATGTYW